MTDALWRLAARTLGLSQVVRPNVGAFFSSELPLPADAAVAIDEIERPSADVNQLPVESASRPRRPPRPQAAKLRVEEVPLRERVAATRTEEHRRERSASPATSPVSTEALGAFAPATALRERAATPIRRPEQSDEVPVLVGHRTIDGTARRAPFARPSPLRLMPIPDAGRRSSRQTNVPAKTDHTRDARQTAPRVKVTIGRVEVRAVLSGAEPATPHRPRQVPELGLEEYVAQRRDGRR